MEKLAVRDSGTHVQWVGPLHRVGTRSERCGVFDADGWAVLSERSGYSTLHAVLGTRPFGLWPSTLGSPSRNESPNWTPSMVKPQAPGEGFVPKSRLHSIEEHASATLHEHHDALISDLREADKDPLGGTTFLVTRRHWRCLPT